MNCPRCNKQLASDAKFCTSCGYSLSLDMLGGTIAASSEKTASSGTPEQTAERSSAPPSGRLIESKYELLDLLGEGGMGMVYRARRLRIGDYVAIKILNERFVTEGTAVERFRREAQAAAVLQHSNVVTIYDYGEEPDKGIPAFIVMELVSGDPLRKILDRERRLAYPRAVAILQSACAGIGAGHRRNIVHRDIKPDNIMVCPPEGEGEGERVKVVDFGIAKLRDLTTANNLTQTGIVMGTPYYMSPEQCRGDSLDARSDVYSLGATLYEMLAGRPPFMASTPTGVVAKHLTEPPPPLPAELGVPPALEAVIQRTLAKDPNARPADAPALARELQAAIAGAPAGQFTIPAQPAFQQTVAVASGGSQPTGGYGGQPTHPQNAVFTQPTPQTFANVEPKKSKTGYLIGALVVVVLLAGGGAAYWIMQDNRNENRNGGPSGNFSSSGNANTQLAGINANVASSNSSIGLPRNTSIPNNRNESINTPTNQNSNTSRPVDNDSTIPGPADVVRAEQKILAGERVSNADIAGLPKPRLRILRNTVYARHGRIFDTADMRTYFNRQSWYTPRNDYRDSALTAADRANIDTILAQENRR